MSETEKSGLLPDFPDREFMEVLTTIDITSDDIKKAIAKLKPSKSQGPDNLHPKFIKECSEQLIKPLKNIFVKSLNEYGNRMYGNRQMSQQFLKVERKLTQKITGQSV